MKKLFILFLCVIFVFIGCGKSENIENPNFGGKISLFAYTPDTLNPLSTAYATNASLFSALLYESLITVNPDLSISPNLAETWSFSENGMTCTLRLHQNSTFSDGTPVTTEHVKLSLEQAMSNPVNLFYSVSDYVESYSSNSNILNLHLKKPGSGVLAHLNFPIIKSADTLLGSGLYAVEENKKSCLILSAVSQSKTNIEKININFYPKKEIMVNSFLSSETDVLVADMSALSKVSSKSNTKSANFVTDNFVYLGFNNNSTILSDEKIRSAIGYLIDKDKLLENIFVGYAEKTNSPFKPNSIYGNLYNGDFNFDKDLAKSFIEESEAESLTFNILVNSESETKKNIAQYVADTLTQYDMNVSVSSMPFDEYLKAIEEENYTMYVGEVNIPSDQDLTFMFNSSGNNLAFNSSYMDSLLHGFSSAIDYNKKLFYAQEIQKELLKQVPIISLCYRTNVLMTSDDIIAELTPLTNNIYYGINNWISKKQ